MRADRVPRSGGATIRSVEVHPLQLRLREPFVVTSGTRDRLDTTLVALRGADGVVGWGEAVPDEPVTGESPDSSLSALSGAIADTVVGLELEDLADLDGLTAALDDVAPDAPAARAAVDIAAHDVLARRAGVPLHVLLGGLLGGRRRSGSGHLTVSRVVGMAPPAEMAAVALGHVADGFSTVKVKVGEAADWELDVERVAAVRSAVGSDVGIKVDVNEGWRVPDVAVAALDRMRESRPLYVEQPVDRTDVEGLAEVRRRVADVAIMADEAVVDHDALRRLIALDAVDLVNLKLMRVGGLRPALRMIATAASAGLRVQIGTMIESSVGSAAGLHLATASADVGFVEMGGPLMLAEDVGDLAGCYDGESVTVPDGPGLGIRVGLNC